MNSTSKLSQQISGQWVSHSFTPVYEVVRANSGNERLIISLPSGDMETISALVDSLEPPYLLLYILHTPRGEGVPGRYQSPELNAEELREIFVRYAHYFSADSRFDLWVHSPSANATVVVDRHNLAYAYGPVHAYLATLDRRGFKEGRPRANFIHQHHYRPEFDEHSVRLLNEFKWIYSPLRTEDEQ